MQSHKLLPKLSRRQTQEKGTSRFYTQKCVKTPRNSHDNIRLHDAVARTSTLQLTDDVFEAYGTTTRPLRKSSFDTAQIPPHSLRPPFSLEEFRRHRGNMQDSSRYEMYVDVPNCGDTTLVLWHRSYQVFVQTTEKVRIVHMLNAKNIVARTIYACLECHEVDIYPPVHSTVSYDGHAVTKYRTVFQQRSKIYLSGSCFLFTGQQS